MDQSGGQPPYYHDLVGWDGFEAEGSKTTIEALLQLGGREVTLEGEAEAYGCSLYGDLTGLGSGMALAGVSLGMTHPQFCSDIQDKAQKGAKSSNTMSPWTHQEFRFPAHSVWSQGNEVC